MHKRSFKKLLVANRGEIAIRIARAAAGLGIRSAAIYSIEDEQCLHVRKADEAHAIGRAGAAAYLDIERVVAIAKQAGCDAIHPGYGFLSENGSFARRAIEEGITFVGPSPEALDLFGDKGVARKLAAKIGVPVVEGTVGATSLDEAKRFFGKLGRPMMIKAVSGGGGRGMRAVRNAEEIEDAYIRCRSEARAAFGDDAVYVERLIEDARHIEVQIVGDRVNAVRHFGERECTIQRRNQKLIEIAPSPSLSEGLRARILDAAIELAVAAKYDNLGTFEFLVDASDSSDRAYFAFIEANPRLQVEHTVTEEVMGIDLVATQIKVAAGCTLEDLGLWRTPAVARGYAVQLRVNMETMDVKGDALPSSGTLTAFEMPSGPGVRVDTFGYVGYRTSTSFDSLLAKLIVHSPSPNFIDAVAKSYRVACEMRIHGVATNISFLQALLSNAEFAANRVNTRFIENNIRPLHAEASATHPQLFFEAAAATEQLVATSSAQKGGPPGTVSVTVPLQSTVVAIDVAEGHQVRAGQQVAVVEAMKMEHLIIAPQSGVVRRISTEIGETLYKDNPILFIEPAEIASTLEVASEAPDLDAIRPDLAEMIARQAFTLDANRPDAVARRRKSNQRTVRENVAALVDDGSFIEYGSLAVAAQRARRTHEDLIRNTPGDGIVTGLGTVNGSNFTHDRSRTMVVAYDYTVLAGTQGQRNHQKQDRMFRLAEELKIPLVLLAEGGGGRPGETEGLGITGLDVKTFGAFARLSGLIPLVGVVSGRCFAGNAALLGCCDVIIATRDTNLGMGGPAMIEGGGLGVYKPEEVGPANVMAPNGVIDILVQDEAEAIETAKKYLSYFQGSLKTWSEPDQRLLRRAIPENRLRVYDIRDVINTLADLGSVLELRSQFGVGIITAFIRIDGQPFGLLANNPKHLGGAIDADASDKAARFVALCDAFDIPLVSLCDTPGFMVGPEAEKSALVRHVSRMFVTAASISVPYFTVVLRKGYGLGAQAMAGGGFHAQKFTISWPTGEFGGMGFDGAVRLGFRREMDAISDPAEREAFFKTKVAELYETGKAISIASVLEIDQVIDPIETRHWIMSGLRSTPKPEQRRSRKRPCVDTW
ncbi:carboxyl transferase domain-containing protein [Bradyrhizobium pachyrhizi]|uniref:carboxyl transferase domain-containing protein n=1 Tax=Bradyrhizobium pachyrhizi TaxID=280333 RepID=UPI00067AB802|nr:carboxyl transferase domain-containing protein [Bradyrhizobium pachyrhizi]